MHSRSVQDKRPANPAKLPSDMLKPQYDHAASPCSAIGHYVFVKDSACFFQILPHKPPASIAAPLHAELGLIPNQVQVTVQFDRSRDEVSRAAPVRVYLGDRYPPMADGNRQPSGPSQCTNLHRNPAPRGAARRWQAKWCWKDDDSSEN